MRSTIDKRLEGSEEASAVVAACIVAACGAGILPSAWEEAISLCVGGEEKRMGEIKLA